MSVYIAIALFVVIFIGGLLCSAFIGSKRTEELYINDYGYQEEMKVLTSEQQKKIVEDILKQAEETQILLMTLLDNQILSPKEFGNAISMLASRTTNLANDIYGMKGVIMCNERFGIGSK